jgi:hypothetical protein
VSDRISSYINSNQLLLTAITINTTFAIGTLYPSHVRAPLSFPRIVSHPGIVASHYASLGSSPWQRHGNPIKKTNTPLFSVRRLLGSVIGHIWSRRCSSLSNKLSIPFGCVYIAFEHPGPPCFCLQAVAEPCPCIHYTISISSHILQEDRYATPSPRLLTPSIFDI